MIQRVMAIPLLAVALAACGGGETGTDGPAGSGGAGGTGANQAPVCGGDFTPCGGDPVGVWRVEETCGAYPGTIDLAGASCKGLPTSTTQALEGVMEFAADGTYRDDVLADVTLAFEIPPVCLADIAQGSSDAVCFTTGVRIRDQQNDGDGPAFAGGCTWRDDACRCEFEYQVPMARTETWSTEGGTMTFATGGPNEYCVDGAWLVRRRLLEDGTYRSIVLARDDGTGGTEGPVCDEDFSPCGGSPVGVWTYDQVCGSEYLTIGIIQELPECRELEAEVRWDRLEGQVTFRANGTFVREAAYDYVTVFDAPVACLEKMAPAAPPGVTCASLGEGLTSREGRHGGCTWVDGARCHCEVGMAGEETLTLGWQLQDNLIGYDYGDHFDVFELCVGDDTLVQRKDGFDRTFVHVLTRVP